ncbi:hypothetical protein F511_24317 [Dorcoceras hygrometricum]|uniref:Uncharacterized protein n=1 Tax=Dorcoceras hygrometricum TaxID=472368 RepID=A0A2Z7B6N8_9LAMI|nr:hypothetical protein F511_24317 [Dorcoceras hygrometricum]
MLGPLVVMGGDNAKALRGCTMWFKRFGDRAEILVLRWPRAGSEGDGDGGRPLVTVVAPGGGLDISGRVPRGKDLSILMASRDSDRVSPENSSDEGGSEIRLSGPNNLDPSRTHIHHERLELENSHEVLRTLGLCAKSDIIIPKKGYMCHEPPSGYFTTYLDHFSNGFSLPPNDLLVEIVHSLGVSFSQFTSNAINAFICFRRLVSQTRIPVTLDLFHALFSARCTGPGSYIYFQPRIDCKKKIDLAEVRALQNGASRRPVKSLWVRPPRRRVGSDSRDAPRRIGSPRLTDRRNSPQPRQRPVADGKSTNDRKKELGPKSGDVPRQSGDDGAQKNLKRSREVENGVPHNVSGGGHLFVEGVNRRDRAGSFWDMSDPDLGWSMGKTYWRSRRTSSLTAANRVTDPCPCLECLPGMLLCCCYVLSLASTIQLREERSRNSESKLHEEIVMLREELLKKQKESDEKYKSCETLHVELEEKSKSYDVLRQELQKLEEKYSVELTTGEHFLNSALGKTLLTSTGDKAVEGYRALSAFRDEVLQQALTIHDQPGDENNEELLGTLDEILGDIDDDEMIEALRQNPI